MKKKGSAARIIYPVILLFFLYAPILVLILMGFNTSKYNQLPIQFTMKWYEALMENDTLLEALRNSLLLALVTAVICMIIGTLYVLGMQALSPKKSQLANSFAMLPMSIPWLIIALAILILIHALGLHKNMLFVEAGHIVITLPYMLLVLKARVQSVNASLEEMSLSLGASAVTTFFRITLPSIASAIIAGAFLVFMISFDNFAISYFLMPSGTSLLPVVIQSSIKYGFTPEINAISTIVICISLICLCLVGLIMKSSLKSMISRDE